MSKAEYLLDVNAFYALTARNHIHHPIVKAWFYASPNLQWAICPFTEAGYIRNATAPRPGQIEMREAEEILKELAQHPGYHYLPITEDWHTLSSPFSKRLFGHKQVTDAYLLGLAMRAGIVLVTFDRAILHMAGEHSSRVLVLSEK